MGAGTAATSQGGRTRRVVPVVVFVFDVSDARDGLGCTCMGRKHGPDTQRGGRGERRAILGPRIGRRRGLRAPRRTSRVFVVLAIDVGAVAVGAPPRVVIVRQTAGGKRSVQPQAVGAVRAEVEGCEGGLLLMVGDEAEQPDRVRVEGASSITQLDPIASEPLKLSENERERVVVHLVVCGLLVMGASLGGPAVGAPLLWYRQKPDAHLRRRRVLRARDDVGAWPRPPWCTGAGAT